MPVAAGAYGEASDGLSSDDSNNSEVVDWNIALAAPIQPSTPRHARSRKRREWRPERVSMPIVGDDGTRAVLDAILTREHYVEQYNGDKGTASRQLDDQVVRIATANLNKRLLHRLRDDMAVWTLGNRLDFVAVSDAGLRGKVEQQIWTSADNGSRVPGLVVTGNARVAIVMDRDRWHGRWRQGLNKYPRSGRSMSITVLLGHKISMVVVATYCPHSPHENAEETTQERMWIARQVAEANARHQLILVAGDFNTYPDEAMDHHGPGERSAAARQESERFVQWTRGTELVSSFKLRHPQKARFTYENNTVRSALDDVYCNSVSAQQLVESGIWCYSLNHGDYVGCPFVVLHLSRAQKSHHRLQGVRAMKAVSTKLKSPEDMALYGQHLDQLVQSRTLQLTQDPPSPNAAPEVICGWLENAIMNLYDGMYRAAKDLWGESSQTKKQIDRAVSIKRTSRCHGQLQAISRGTVESSEEQVRVAIARVEWPKWVLMPERISPNASHKHGTEALNRWRRTGPTTWEWLQEGIRLWRSVLRVRRNWRQTKSRQNHAATRERWMATGRVKQMLQDTLGRALPPVHIQGALVREGDEYVYIESWAAVKQAMQELLDSWIPAAEKTTAPRHFTTDAIVDEDTLPQFVREWMLDDIKAGGTRRDAFTEPGNGWAEFKYDEATQQRVDAAVRKRVAPGFGGVSQEMWIAAPESVRAQERMILQLIVQSGVAPPVLNRRQMVFLPKSSTATGIWNRDGLPPWRSITMQSALAIRLFTAVSNFLEAKAPNHAMQHGFQRDRNAQDAALTSTLLVERAVRRKESLYVLSKDCAKCYDRIPRWVMSYIYRRLGVPSTLLSILMGFLAAGKISIKTAYGWISGGVREFGLGQGSVLSIRHIGYYMDLLMEQQAEGRDALVVKTQQSRAPQIIGSTVLVDDVVDVATTRAGIEERARVSNVFTGLHGTGGVFGASKSFLLHYSPSGLRAAHSVFSMMVWTCRERYTMSVLLKASST